MNFQFRNWQKRFYYKETPYFVTFYTKNRFPYFKEKILCDLFIENLKTCKKLKQFKLYGWVICYEHIHLLIQPGDTTNISEVIHIIKLRSSRNVNIVMELTKTPESADESRMTPHSESADGHPHFLGFDSYIKKLRKQFLRKYTDHHPFPKFEWQKSFHDHYIRNQKDFNYYMGYIIYNVEKHGLPNETGPIYTQMQIIMT